MITALRPPLAGILLALAACQRPQAIPWEGRLAVAQGRAAPMHLEGQRKDYEAGFLTGAKMVHSALQAGQRPYRLVLDTAGSPEFRLGGTDAAAASAAAPEPRVEMDPATGLLRMALSPEDPFARGMVAGFDWAMGEEGQPLVRPVASPTRPTAWQPWPKAVGVLGLQDGDRALRLRWAGGILAWQASSRGFPEQRGWRSWPDPERPAWVAFSGNALWVETAAGQALALDPGTGAIMTVAAAVDHPRPAPPPDGDPLRAHYAKLSRAPDYQQRVLELTSEARQGKVSAMLALARELRGIDATGDREAYDWMLKAAEAGNLEAMVDVGTSCFHGLGRPADREEARRWLLRAEQAGSPTAREVRRLLFEVGTAP